MAKKTKYVNSFGVKKGGIEYKIPEGKPHAGETRILLTPEGKRAKYNLELETGVKLTNEGEPKRNKDESLKYLNASERGFRTGFISSQNEQRAIYARNHAQKK